MMLLLAAVVLIIASLLSVAAIFSFPWSPWAAKTLLLAANAAAVVAALELALAGELSGLGTWALLFAGGAFGCGTSATRNLFARPSRWIHRFVIYGGYQATFAAMGATAVFLHARQSSRALAAATFIGVYAAGSLCIFLAKTQTLRVMAKKMPEYAKSIGADLSTGLR